MSIRPLFTSTLLASLVLTACGGDGGENAGGDATAAGTAGQQASAGKSTPGQQASRDCPAKTTTGARPEGAPVDDIIGIRNGMSFDDAQWILECRDDLTTVEVGDRWSVQQTYGFPLRQVLIGRDGVECTGQEIAKDMGSYSSKKCRDTGYRMKAKKDISHQVSVVFTGMPGEEQVGGVWRRNDFAEGSQPTKEALMASMVKKYGEPQHNDGKGNIYWVFDPFLNRPMSPQSPAFNTCYAYIGAEFGSSHSWRTNCGLTVSAQIGSVYGNELLASHLSIGIVDQKTLYEQGVAFEETLKAASEAKKQEEAAKASSNAATPDL